MKINTGRFRRPMILLTKNTYLPAYFDPASESRYEREARLQEDSKTKTNGTNKSGN